MTDAQQPTSKVAFFRLGPRTLVPLARGQASNFTDPMTNAMSLNKMDIRSMLSDAQPGNLELSDQGLRFFLHEVTHHASFAADVGNAQSALAVSVCARASIGKPPAERADLWLA